MIKSIKKILLRLPVTKIMYLVFMITALIRWNQGLEHVALWMLMMANMMLILER